MHTIVTVPIVRCDFGTYEYKYQTNVALSMECSDSYSDNLIYPRERFSFTIYPKHALNKKQTYRCSEQCQRQQISVH